MSAMIVEAVDGALAELVPLLGVKDACDAVGVARQPRPAAASLERGAPGAAHPRRARSSGSSAAPGTSSCSAPRQPPASFVDGWTATTRPGPEAGA